MVMILDRKLWFNPNNNRLAYYLIGGQHPAN